MFKHVPYKLDTITSANAIVGNGAVYAQNDYYFYYSEINKKDTMSAAITREFSQVMKYGISPDLCTTSKIRSEEGFMNGFCVVYEISKVSVPADSGAVGTKDAYMLSYRLEINDSDNIADNIDIIIGVATNTLSTDALAKSKQLLDASIMTVQYSNSMAADIERAIKNGTFEGVLVGDSGNGQSGNSSLGNSGVDVSNSESSSESTEGTESTGSTVGGTLTNEPVSSDVKTMGILLKQDYDDLTLFVDWTNLEAKPTLTFSDVREKISYSPSTYDDGRAVFNIGQIEAGVYMVKITGWEDAGTFTSNSVGE